MSNLFGSYGFYLPCRKEEKEHGDDEASERTNPRKSLEEEYLETEKKVILSPCKPGLVVLVHSHFFT